MTESISLKGLRGQAVRAFLQDGLVELLLGMAFGWWAAVLLAYVFLDFEALVVCWLPWLFLMVGLPAARRRLVYPRMGRVEVVSARAWTVVAVLGGMVVVGLAAMDLLGAVVPAAPHYEAVPATNPAFDVVRSNLSALAGIVLAGVLAFVAYRYAIYRFFAFALISLIGGVFLAMLDMDGWPTTPLRWALYCAVMGIVIITSGAIRVFRFRREHPVLPEGGEKEGPKATGAPEGEGSR
jgi:hypothetical protein